MSWIIFFVMCGAFYLLGRYHERSRTLEKEKYGVDKSWIGKVVDVTAHRLTGIPKNNPNEKRQI